MLGWRGKGGIHCGLEQERGEWFDLFVKNGWSGLNAAIVLMSLIDLGFSTYPIGL